MEENKNPPALASEEKDFDQFPGTTETSNIQEFLSQSEAAEEIASCIKCKNIPENYIALSCNHNFCLYCIIESYMDPNYCKRGQQSSQTDEEEGQLATLICEICQCTTTLDANSIMAIENCIQIEFLDNMQLQQQQQDQQQQQLQQNEPEDYISDNQNRAEDNNNNFQEQEEQVAFTQLQNRATAQSHQSQKQQSYTNTNNSSTYATFKPPVPTNGQGSPNFQTNGPNRQPSEPCLEGNNYNTKIMDSQRNSTKISDDMVRNSQKYFMDIFKQSESSVNCNMNAGITSNGGNNNNGNNTLNFSSRNYGNGSCNYSSNGNGNTSNNNSVVITSSLNNYNYINNNNGVQSQLVRDRSSSNISGQQGQQSNQQQPSTDHQETRNYAINAPGLLETCCPEHPYEEACFFCFTCEQKCFCHICLGGETVENSRGLQQQQQKQQTIHANHDVRCLDKNRQKDYTSPRTNVNAAMNACSNLLKQRTKQTISELQNKIEQSEQTEKNQDSLLLQLDQRLGDCTKQGTEMFAGLQRLLEEKQERFTEYMKRIYTGRATAIQREADGAGELHRTMISLRDQLLSFEQSNNNCLATSDTSDMILAFNYFADCKRILTELTQRSLGQEEQEMQDFQLANQFPEVEQVLSEISSFKSILEQSLLIPETIPQGDLPATRLEVSSTDQQQQQSIELISRSIQPPPQLLQLQMKKEQQQKQNQQLAQKSTKPQALTQAQKQIQPQQQTLEKQQPQQQQDESCPNTNKGLKQKQKAYSMSRNPQQLNNNFENQVSDRQVVEAPVTKVNNISKSSNCTGTNFHKAEQNLIERTDQLLNQLVCLTGGDSLSENADGAVDNSRVESIFDMVEAKDSEPDTKKKAVTAGNEKQQHFFNGQYLQGIQNTQQPQQKLSEKELGQSSNNNRLKSKHSSKLTEASAAGHLKSYCLPTSFQEHKRSSTPHTTATQCGGGTTTQYSSSSQSTGLNQLNKIFQEKGNQIFSQRDRTGSFLGGGNSNNSCYGKDNFSSLLTGCLSISSNSLGTGNTNKNGGENSSYTSRQRLTALQPFSNRVSGNVLLDQAFKGQATTSTLGLKQPQILLNKQVNKPKITDQSPFQTLKMQREQYESSKRMFKLGV